MTEFVNTYLLDDPDVLVPMSRAEFYDEQINVFKSTGKPTRAVEITNIMLFNTNKEILIQKRSYNKAHNPGLLDKSLGGHVQHGDTVDFTVMVETVQELQTPSIVLKNTADFNRAKQLLGGYFSTIALIKHERTEVLVIPKLIQGKNISIANKAHLFFGIYDGRVRPADREAKGVLWYSFNELGREMDKFPDIFTQDIHLFWNRYQKELQTFADDIV